MSKLYTFVNAWIVEELDTKLILICGIFNALTAFKRTVHVVANYDITKSSKHACLTLIQRNILDQKIINITTLSAMKYPSRPVNLTKYFKN